MSAPLRVRGNANRQWSPGAAGPVLNPMTRIFAWLADEIRDLAWQDDALCAEVGGDWWFPEKGGSVREAKRVCGQCPVQEACLEHALATGERFGIYGGKTERERRRIQHQREQVAA